MFFKITFLISLLAIIILWFSQEQKKRFQLLHSILKSCNIDSVRFEKKLVLFFFVIKRFKKKLLEKIKKIHTFFQSQSNSFLGKTKKSIRKKLFAPKQKENISEFISEMHKK